MKNKCNGLAVICLVTIVSSFLGTAAGNKLNNNSVAAVNEETITDRAPKFGDKIKVASGFYKSCIGQVVGLGTFQTTYAVRIECSSIPDTTITTDLPADELNIISAAE
jgi:hypothetical protein